MRLFGQSRSAPLAAALELLLILPVFVMAEVQAGDENMLRHWHHVQVQSHREQRADWWRRLGVERLVAFIDAGADVNLSDKSGWRPLHSAARYSPDPGIVITLLDGNADVGATNRSGDTPLHWAAAENTNVEVLRVLIHAGADVNRRDEFGWLPLHTAAESNSNPEVIEFLLAAGSDKKKRAYFILFSPAFLLKHNARMSNPDKERALAMLRGAGSAEGDKSKQN